MISRRCFIAFTSNAALTGLMAGACNASESRTVTLTAEFAAQVPGEVRIDGPVCSRIRELPGRVFELRTYKTVSADLEKSLEEIFPRSGIHPLIQSELTYLIPFESLAAREQAWNLLNADPDWQRIRHEVVSYQFGLYRLSA